MNNECGQARVASPELPTRAIRGLPDLPEMGLDVENDLIFEIPFQYFVPRWCFVDFFHEIHFVLSTKLTIF